VFNVGKHIVALSTRFSLDSRLRGNDAGGYLGRGFLPNIAIACYCNCALVAPGCLVTVLSLTSKTAQNNRPFIIL